mgnify:CR=1 FL=1
MMRKQSKSAHVLLLWLVSLVILGIGCSVYIIYATLTTGSLSLSASNKYLVVIICVILLYLLPILLIACHYAKFEKNRRLLLIARILSIHHIVCATGIILTIILKNASNAG